MEAELHYIDSDRAALVWAFGCAVASTKERAKNMGSNLTPRQAARMNIAIAAAFAVVILIVSFAMKKSPHVWAALTPIMALWFVPFGYLSKIEEAGRRACRSKTDSQID